MRDGGSGFAFGGPSAKADLETLFSNALDAIPERIRPPREAVGAEGPITETHDDRGDERFALASAATPARVTVPRTVLLKSPPRAMTLRTPTARTRSHLSPSSPPLDHDATVARRQERVSASADALAAERHSLAQEYAQLKCAREARESEIATLDRAREAANDARGETRKRRTDESIVKDNAARKALVDATRAVKNAAASANRSSDFETQADVEVAGFAAATAAWQLALAIAQFEVEN